MTALATHTDLDVTDYFCGMGGSSSGLVAAGWNVKLAANHWQTAIDTHAANHPGTEHLCADLQTVDVRYLPHTRALWASPICTEISPAGGRKKREPQASLWEEYGHVPAEAFERTRVTFWEILRAAEVHHYDTIMIENVLEAFDWPLLPVWLAGLETLGYEIQIVSVSAAHVGGVDNPHAPQLRDRIYWVARRRGLAPFNLDPRPLSWCDQCDSLVDGVQVWKPAKSTSRQWKGQRAGKYGAQYHYACPVDFRHGRVEPLIMPAAAAIDWTDLGSRLGDRKRPLGDSTMRRIRMGLEMISNPALVAAGGNTYDSASGSGNRYLRADDPHRWPLPTQTTAAQSAIATITTLNHGDHGGDTSRSFDPTGYPLPTRSTKNGDALVMTEPFITMLRNHGRATTIDEPLQTIAAGGFHHALTVPGSFVMSQYGGQLNGSPLAVRDVSTPLPPMVASSMPSLVIPYRRGARPHATDEPLSTIATHDQHGLMTDGIDLDDVRFRMLTPRESATAQRFADDYIIHGNKGEQQMQAGNAVAVNVAQWIGSRVAAGLNGAAA